MITITEKDIVYLVTYIITFISLLLAIKNSVKNQSRQIKLMKDVIFGEKGKLNLIDQDTLAKHLDQIWTRMRQNEMVAELVRNKMDDIDKNVLAIMIVLEIKKQNGIDVIGIKKTDGSKKN